MNVRYSVHVLCLLFYSPINLCFDFFSRQLPFFAIRYKKGKKGERERKREREKEKLIKVLLPQVLVSFSEDVDNEIDGSVYAQSSANNISNIYTNVDTIHMETF